MHGRCCKGSIPAGDWPQLLSASQVFEHCFRMEWCMQCFSAVINLLPSRIVTHQLAYDASCHILYS